MIRTVAEFGITAMHNPSDRGVWVGNKKLGSIGISVRRNISFHGFAPNVNLASEPSEWIEPCGLRGIRMTSVAQELSSQNIFVKDVRNVLKRHIEAVFNVTLKECRTKNFLVQVFLRNC